MPNAISSICSKVRDESTDHAVDTASSARKTPTVTSMVRSWRSRLTPSPQNATTRPAAARKIAWIQMSSEGATVRSASSARAHVTGTAGGNQQQHDAGDPCHGCAPRWTGAAVGIVKLRDRFVRCCLDVDHWRATVAGSVTGVRPATTLTLALLLAAILVAGLLSLARL
ncbi:hypothetical protein BH23ACT3_BH23ACT3_05510 [soil metagenome]